MNAATCRAFAVKSGPARALTCPIQGSEAGCVAAPVLRSASAGTPLVSRLRGPASARRARMPACAG